MSVARHKDFATDYLCFRMKALSFKEPWLKSTVERLLGLSVTTKRAIIRALERSLEEPKKQRRGSSLDAFGMWEGDGTADELIAKIRSARNFSRAREKF